MRIVDITVQLLHQTDEAILVTDDGKNNVWLPKSLVEYELKKDELYDVQLPEWLAKEKGLI